MISVENISVGYGETNVLSDVSFELRRGEIVAILGTNGAGKTTLLRSLNAAIPVSKGTVSIDGKPIASFSRAELARKMAVVSQENLTRFPITVTEFVLGGRFAHGRAFGWESETDLAAAEEAMSQCDVLRFASRPMNELSGGERQRVVLARAVAAQTTLLLLDEPTANIDLAHQALIFNLLRKKRRESGTTAAVITHDLNIAAEFADRVILLSMGRIAALGPPRDVLKGEVLTDAFGIGISVDHDHANGKIRISVDY